MARQRYTFSNFYGLWQTINQYLPNPDLVLQRQGRDNSLYLNLLTDSHLCAALESRESATLSHTWQLNKKDTPTKFAKIIEYWFFNYLNEKTSIADLDFHELSDNMLDVIYWGYQPIELTWDLVRGFWLPRVLPKPPYWFRWYIKDGVPELRFMSTNNPTDGDPPRDIFTLICPRIKPSFDNPYGRGIASRCFWPIVFKKAGMEFWLNYLERFGTPWVKGTLKTGDAETLTNFATDLKALVQDAVIALTEDKDVSLLETSQGKDASQGFQMMLDYMDSQMSKTILGHTLSTDQGSNGSYAATRSAMTVRDDIGVSDTVTMMSTYNQIIQLIARKNGYSNIQLPSISPYKKEGVDIERAQRDESLTRSGVRFSKFYYMREYKLSENDIETIVDPSGRDVTGIEVNKNKINSAGKTPEEKRE